MKSLCICVLLAMLVDQLVLGGRYRQRNEPRDLTNVIEKAQGNAEQLKRLLRIKEIRNQRHIDAAPVNELPDAPEAPPNDSDGTKDFQENESRPSLAQTDEGITPQFVDEAYNNRKNVNKPQGGRWNGITDNWNKVRLDKKPKPSIDVPNDNHKQKGKFTKKRKPKQKTSQKKKKKLNRQKVNKNKLSKNRKKEKNKSGKENDSNQARTEDTIRKLTLKQCLKLGILQLMPHAKQDQHADDTADEVNVNIPTMPPINDLPTDDLWTANSRLNDIPAVAQVQEEPRIASSHFKVEEADSSLLSDKILWLGIAVGSGFSFIMFILCCCLYKCLLHYRASVGVPLKEALGLFKASDDGDKSPMHIRLSQKKGDSKAGSQYVVSIMGKNELDLESSSDEEEVFNRSAVKHDGSSSSVNRTSTPLSTPSKTRKPLLQ